MKLTRKVYGTGREKVIDFVIGFIGWFLLNGILYTCSVATINALASSDSPDSLIPIVLLSLPLLINIGVLVALAFSRYWIALGALAAFAASLLVVLVLGVLVWAVCFTSSSTL